MSRAMVMGLLLVSMGALGCADPPLVVQGTVLTVDDGAKTLTLEEEGAATSVMVLDMTNADIGAPPEKGNLVRAAYRVVNGRPTASRVMNLTKQAELRESKGGH